MGILAIARFAVGSHPPSRVAAQQQQLFGGVHVYRSAEEADFRGLDLKFYETSTAEFTKEGFILLGDVVNFSIENAWPRHRCVIRRFVSRDGSAMACAYHVKLLGAFGLLQMIRDVSKQFKICECESELADGTFLTTSNAARANRTAGYPFVNRVQFGSETSIQQIVLEHRQRIQSIGRDDAGKIPIPIRTMRDYQASQDRLQQLRCAYRKSPDFDFRAEVQSVRGHPLTEHERAFADEVANQLRDSASRNNAPEK